MSGVYLEIIAVRCYGQNAPSKIVWNIACTNDSSTVNMLLVHAVKYKQNTFENIYFITVTQLVTCQLIVIRKGILSARCSLLKEIKKAVGNYEQSKSKKVNDKKEGIKVNTVFLVKRQVFGICLFAESFVVDENDNVEEEGAEDEDDAAEDPNGKGGQSS